ncbi:four-carbon acid sugar kinase family protein [Actinomycetospora endophytica]|uniref:Four-carbon acid sugar kinase family protein n=1 Tax=Actinomycetospora endophytica TaxID=2291215 RepID=A0ABS8P3D3_9PSEU|nr:four-carbon acid sugar kinase family protein [Actinomycetospora endophytica]MCD2191921.1 four-carbon acid sugar kinase family protein [Actinomycetospora endophytica]
MAAAVVGFFADDLTGASDVLARAHRHGLDAALVLDPATGLPDADVVGIAGTARSLSGAELEAEVRAGLVPIAARPDLDVVLYKVCSTFDSSPTTGSIGRGIELLAEAFPRHGPVPVAPAQPDFGRYTAFSNHFGRSGDAVHRLDRHPVMAHHPSTPMHEADLRRVLGEQLTGTPDLPAVQLPAHADGSFARRWAEERTGRGPAFVVDATTEEDMDRVAAALLDDPGPGPALVVGSGGVMAALARRRGRSAPVPPSGARATGPVLVVSASASAVTGDQIGDAVGAGWCEVAVPLPGEDDDGAWVSRVVDGLRRGEHVVAHTVRGPQDERLRDGPVSPRAVGGRLAEAVRAAVTDGHTRDVMVCGGDTSSHALAALGVRELRVTDQFVPVGPICRTDDDAVPAGCRLVLKGGQVGPVDILRRFADGLEEAR